nr:MAG: hypothetical protein CM15mV30_0410 [uncultured marine virus]
MKKFGHKSVGNVRSREEEIFDYVDANYKAEKETD